MTCSCCLVLSLVVFSRLPCREKPAGSPVLGIVMGQPSSTSDHNKGSTHGKQNNSGPAIGEVQIWLCCCSGRRTALLSTKCALSTACPPHLHGMPRLWLDAGSNTGKKAGWQRRQRRHATPSTRSKSRKRPTESHNEEFRRQQLALEAGIRRHERLM
jgi:hypothetical protein